MEMPYQCPSGSRYWGATILSSTSDLIGCVMPARTASSMRPISTVSSTSAGLLALGLDALFEARACGDDVDLDAGVPGEGVEQRLDELALAISVDIDIAGLGERGASSSDCTHDHRTTRERANGLHGQSSVATFA